LLGEPLDVVTLGFAAAVVATVVAGKRLSQPPAALRPVPFKPAQEAPTP
ncbi:MAG: EamA family transporter, partial [Variovorax sp.]